MSAALVAVLMGSSSDYPVMKGAVEMLERTEGDDDGVKLRPLRRRAADALQELRYIVFEHPTIRSGSMIRISMSRWIGPPSSGASTADPFNTSECSRVIAASPPIAVRALAMISRAFSSDLFEPMTLSTTVPAPIKASDATIVETTNLFIMPPVCWKF